MSRNLVVNPAAAFAFAPAEASAAENNALIKELQGIGQKAYEYAKANNFDEPTRAAYQHAVALDAINQVRGQIKDVNTLKDMYQTVMGYENQESAGFWQGLKDVGNSLGAGWETGVAQLQSFIDPTWGDDNRAAAAEHRAALSNTAKADRVRADNAYQFREAIGDNPWQITENLKERPLDAVAELGGNIAPSVAGVVAGTAASATGVGAAAGVPIALASLGIGAAQSGGAVRDDIYTTTMQMTTKELEQYSPAYQELIKQGVSPEDAKRTVATSLADNWGEFLGATALGAAANFIPAGGAGKNFITKALGQLAYSPERGLFNNALREGVVEAGTEAWQQRLSNSAIKDQVDTRRDLNQGVGEAAVIGGVVGTGISAGAGSLVHSRMNQGETQAPQSSVDQAINPTQQSQPAAEPASQVQGNPATEQVQGQPTAYDSEALSNAASKLPEADRKRYIEDFETDAKYGILDTESDTPYGRFVRDVLGLGNTVQPTADDAVAQVGETVPDNLHYHTSTRVEDSIGASNKDSLYEPGDQAAVDQTIPDVDGQSGRRVTKKVARQKQSNDKYYDIDDQQAAADSSVPRTSSLDRQRVKHIRGSKKFQAINDADYDGVNNVVLEPETATQPVEDIATAKTEEVKPKEAIKVSYVDNAKVAQFANANLNEYTPAELEERARKELNGNEYRLLVAMLKERTAADYDADGNFIGKASELEGNNAKRERKPEKKATWVAKQFERFAVKQAEPASEPASEPAAQVETGNAPSGQAAEPVTNDTQADQNIMNDTQHATNDTPVESSITNDTNDEYKTVSQALTDAGAKHTHVEHNTDFDSNYWKVRDHGFAVNEDFLNNLTENIGEATEAGVPDIFAGDQRISQEFGSRAAEFTTAAARTFPADDELVVMATTAPIGVKKFSSEPAVTDSYGKLSTTSNPPVFTTDVSAAQQIAGAIDGRVHGAYIRADNIYPWTGSDLSRAQRIELSRWAADQGYDGVAFNDNGNISYVPSKTGTTMGTNLTASKTGRVQKDAFYAQGSSSFVPRVQGWRAKLLEKFISKHYDKQIEKVEKTIDDIAAGKVGLDSLPRTGSWALMLNPEGQRRWFEATKRLVDTIADREGWPQTLRDRIYLTAPRRHERSDTAASYNPHDSRIRVRTLEEDIAKLASYLIHEVGHRQSHVLRNTIGLENYINLTERLRTNKFINRLLQSGTSKHYQRVEEGMEHYLSKPYLYIEEIIVDMSAAVRSNNWDIFAKRYGIKKSDIPVELTRKTNNIITKAYDAMRRAFKSVLDILNGGKPVSDAQVRDYVESLGSLNQRSVFSIDYDVLTQIAHDKGYDNASELISDKNLRTDKERTDFVLDELNAGILKHDADVLPEYNERISGIEQAYAKKTGKKLGNELSHSMAFYAQGSNNQDVLDFARTGKSADADTGIFGTGAKTWGDLVKKIGRGIERRISDDLIPMKEYLENLGLDNNTTQSLIGDLYLADGAKANKSSELEHKYMVPLFKKIHDIAKANNMEYIDAKRAVGFWMSARYALIKNQDFIRQDQQAYQDASNEYNQNPTQQNYDKMMKARRQLAKRQADVFNPDPAATNFEVGVAGGYNNAKAQAVMQGLENLIPKADIEEAAQHIYDMQAARLDLDLESGRIGQQAYNEYKANPYYVPLTGDPRADSEFDDVINTGGQSVNQRGQKQAKGRKDSMAEDGIDATWRSVARSVGYFGYSKFKNGIRDVYKARYNELLNQGKTEQEAAAQIEEEMGITREKVTMHRTSDSVLMVSENGDNYAYKLPKKAMDALMHNQRENTPWILKAAEIPTRAFARAVTQFYPAFAPINFARDAWERSTVLRTRTVYDANGNKVDMGAVSNRMLMKMSDPMAFRDTVFWTTPDGKTQRSKNLQDLMEAGGLSTMGSFLARTEKDLIKRIEREGRWDKKTIDGVVKFTEAYNRAFDLVPPLAAYESLLEAGVEKRAAAAAVLDTMNFRKTGLYMRPIKALYMFAQPTATGFVNLAKQLSTKKGAIMAATYYATMLGLYEVIRAVSGQDDNEAGNKVDQMGDITRYIPIPNPADPGKYFKIPVGFGLPQLMWNMATNTSRAAHGDIPLSSAAANMAAHWSKVVVPVAPADIPVDEAPGAKLAMTATPSILQPFMQIVLDRTPFGAKLTPQYVDNGKLRSEQSKSTTAPEWKEFAVAIQRVTGIDMHAEQVKALWDGYSGMLGPLRDVTKIAIENPNRKRLGKEEYVPFVNSLYGPGNEYSIQQRYYEAFDKAKQVKNEYDSRKERGQLKDWLTPERRRQISWFERADRESRVINQQKAKVTKRHGNGMSDDVYQKQVNNFAKRSEQVQAKYLNEWRKMEGLYTKRGK